MNDQPATDLEIVRQIKQMAKKPQPVPQQPLPVEQLLLDGVDQIAHQWVEQLDLLCANAEALKAQVIACVAKSKDDLKRLYQLGAQVSAEAKRGQEVCQTMADGLEQIAAKP